MCVQNIYAYIKLNNQKRQLFTSKSNLKMHINLELVACPLGRSPGGGHGNPLQYSCLENPPGQRCLAGYSCKRLGTTERLSRAQHGTGRNNRKIGETELAVERKICRKGRQGKTTIIITSIHYFPGPSSPGYGFSSGHVRK